MEILGVRLVGVNAENGKKLLFMRPRVYYRLTDNWLELTVRFIAKDHGIRALKDSISRDILRGLDQAAVAVASATFEVVGVPPLRIQGGQNGSASERAESEPRRATERPVTPSRFRP